MIKRKKINRNIDKENSKPKFDPKKKYRWTPENKFELDGIQFAIVLNKLLRRKQEIAEELEAINVMEKVLEQAVESGIAVEVEASE